MNKPIRSIIFCCLLLTPLTLLAEIQPRIVGGAQSSVNAWPFMTALMLKTAGLSVNGEPYSAFFMEGPPAKVFSGTLANCDQGIDACENVSGKICLIERGGVLSNGEFSTFTSKINRCSASGGIAAIIYNNVEGIFFGVATASIPAVSVSRISGLSLLNQLNQVVQFGYLNDIPTDSFCGGSYIGGKWVLTAAHCVDEISVDSLVLNIGAFNLETDQENIFYAADIAIHPEYSSETIENDFAIIELTAAPQGITPVQIPYEMLLSLAIERFSDVTAIGRGLKSPVTINEAPPSEVPDPLLYEVNLSLVGNAACRTKMGDSSITDSMLCAGDLAGDVGTCFGDSGGPLVLTQSGVNYLVGITSWGFGCAQPDYYGVYSRVPHFKNSIDTVLRKNSIDTFRGNQTVRNYFSSGSNKSGGSLGGELGLLFLYAFFRVMRRPRAKLKNTHKTRPAPGDSEEPLAKSFNLQRL